MEAKQLPTPFTYTVTEFVLGEVGGSPVDESRIPVYDNNAAARAAGHAQWDIFRTPDGQVRAVGPHPFAEDGVPQANALRLIAA